MTSFSITREPKLDNSANGKYKRRVEGKGLGEFVGVDGEGAGYGRDHTYVLLGIGDRYIENIEGITWREAFEFLYGVFQESPRATYVGFFLGYDFTQLLKTLPEDRARMLLTEKGINARKRKRSGGNPKPFPVRHDGWEFDMLPGRRLQIRPQSCNCYEKSGYRKCDHSPNLWMYVNDTGPFWQTSLVNVINPAGWHNPVVSPDEYRFIEDRKAKRSMSIPEYVRDRKEIIRYNQLENDILSRCMSSLRSGFLDIGVNLKRDQWFGPGQASAAWFKKNGIPTRVQVEKMVPESYLEACRASYFGGWFEIFSHGIVPGKSHEYDINSAYPHIIRSLPCLRHGRYLSGDNRLPDNLPAKSLSIVYCRIRGSSEYIGAMPNRDEIGNIRRPHETEGWYWLHEVEAARRAHLVDSYEIERWECYIPCDCPCPVRGFLDLYQHRLSVGKDSVLGKSCKLVYNSGYGKFAQSTGSSPFGNWIYASLITAGCREMILDAIASHPHGAKSVLMVATDGIFFDKPHPGLPVSKALGEWDYAERENLTLFKPGIYWDDNTRRQLAAGDTVKFKARGINARDFAKNIGEIDRQFLSSISPVPGFRIKLWEREKFTTYEEKDWPKVEFEIGFNMMSARSALNFGLWEYAGEVRTHVKVKQDSDPITKRGKAYWDKVDNRLRSRPVDISPGEVLSVPYSKGMGIEDPFGMEYREAQGINPDGTMGDKMAQYAAILAGKE